MSDQITDTAKNLNPRGRGGVGGGQQKAEQRGFSSWLSFLHYEAAETQAWEEEEEGRAIPFSSSTDFDQL